MLEPTPGTIFFTPHATRRPPVTEQAHRGNTVAARNLLTRELETEEDGTAPVILVDDWLPEVRERVGRQRG